MYYGDSSILQCPSVNISIFSMFPIFAAAHQNAFITLFIPYLLQQFSVPCDTLLQLLFCHDPAARCMILLCLSDLQLIKFYIRPFPMRRDRQDYEKLLGGRGHSIPSTMLLYVPCYARLFSLVVRVYLRHCRMADATFVSFLLLRPGRPQEDSSAEIAA